MVASCALGAARVLLAVGLHARCGPPACSAADAPWACFSRFNADASWRGYAVSIDPATAVPSLPGIPYDHFVASEGSGDALRLRTTTTANGEQRVESLRLDGATLDVDLDGSYSAEHGSGLGLASLLLGRADGDGGERCIAIEHSLAVSDDERRRRCLRGNRSANSVQSPGSSTLSLRGSTATSAVVTKSSPFCSCRSTTFQS